MGAWMTTFISKKCILSPSVIQNAKPPEGGRIVLKDRQVVGLVCRVSSSGTATFSVYKRINGSPPERITIGRFPSISVKVARRLASKIIGEIAEGKNPAKVKRILKRELTFNELFYEFLEKHSKIKKRTWKSDLSQYNLYLKDTIGRLRLSHITKSHINSIIVDATCRVKSKDPITGEIEYVTGMTANRILALLKTVFNWGISLDLCEVNPAARIKKNPEKSRTRFLQADELPRFFQALEKEDNEIVRDFILISLLTGARRSNILSMKWCDIFLERKEWIIPRTKNNEPQTVVLSREAAEILSRRKKDSKTDFVFPGEGMHGHFNDPKKGWKRLLMRAGIENLRLHDLRRTLGSWQAKTGASLLVIGKSLGHKSLQSTSVYARLDLEPVRQSVQSASRAIFMAAQRKKINQTFNKVAIKQIKQIDFTQLIGIKIT
jgi:integrase